MGVEPLETVDIGAPGMAAAGDAAAAVAPPPDLGFLFCMCQRDDEADVAAACAPAELPERTTPAVAPPALPREPKMFGPVHEEVLFACVVASRMAYADRHVADALAAEGGYAQGLDFIDKVLPRFAAVDSETVAAGAYCIFELARPRYPEAHAPGSTAIVAFRGTMDRDDARTNLNVAQCDFEPIYAQGRVHAGFYARATSANYDPIANLFARYDRVVFCGHSLGGAVAQIAALRCLVSAVPRLDAAAAASRLLCVTFGAPTGGNGPPSDASVFALVEKQEPWRDLFLNVVHENDPVPRLLLHVDAVAGASGDARDRADSAESVESEEFDIEAEASEAGEPAAAAEEEDAVGWGQRLRNAGSALARGFSRSDGDGGDEPASPSARERSERSERSSTYAGRAAEFTLQVARRAMVSDDYHPFGNWLHLNGDRADFYEGGRDSRELCRSLTDLVVADHSMKLGYAAFFERHCAPLPGPLPGFERKHRATHKLRMFPVEISLYQNQRLDPFADFGSAALMPRAMGDPAAFTQEREFRRGYNHDELADAFDAAARYLGPGYEFDDASSSAVTDGMVDRYEPGDADGWIYASDYRGEMMAWFETHCDAKELGSYGRPTTARAMTSFFRQRKITRVARMRHIPPASPISRL